MNEESKRKTFFKYEKTNSTATKNGTVEKSVKIRNTIKNASNNLKRLSCEELENLKERFVDFIKLDQEQEEGLNSQMSLINQLPSPPLPPPPPPPPPSTSTSTQSQQLTLKSSTNKQSRLSIMSCDSSSAESSTSSTSSTSCNSKPEPPQRTVSIRNSTCNIYSSSSILNDLKQSDDLISIKSSSIYSSCRSSLLNQTQSILPVRSSRSVFSIYEEEDENSSAISSNSSTSTSSNSSMLINANKKLERIKDYEIQKIESMYRSIGSIVNVSQSTCDLMSTTSEQIANLLNDCWKLEISSVVPVWIFDTGYNPKRVKQLRLIFVHRTTGFPLVKQNILIDDTNQIKNPNNDKRLTFTLKNNQLVCLIKFYDYFSCQEFYKFYIDLVNNTRNIDLFGRINLSQSNNKLNQTSMAKIHSRSMISLSKLSNEKCVNNSNNYKKKIININKNRRKRYSDLICLDNDEYNNNNKCNQIDMSTTSNKNKQMITTITKHCISNPCAFQHINSLKNNDQYVQEVIGDNCDDNDDDDDDDKMKLIVNSISSSKLNDSKLHYNYFFKSNNDQVQKKVLK